VFSIIEYTCTLHLLLPRCQSPQFIFASSTTIPLRTVETFEILTGVRVTEVKVGAGGDRSGGVCESEGEATVGCNAVEGATI
jgi:hypothetical protein